MSRGHTAQGRIRVGIGGWVFEPWRETFYPPDVPKARELAYAARHVTTIEINATFYRTQSAQSFRKWAAETPDDFVFSVKANRFAVNRKDLADGDESIRRFVESGVTELGPKLGPILWQLAGTKKFVASEIDGFLSNLPAEADGRRLRHAIEPRHPSFVCAEFVTLARKHNVAVVLALSEDYPLIADVTADFCYLRLQTTRSDEPEGFDAVTRDDWVDKLRALAAGDSAPGLPLLAPPAKRQPRDCFAYCIAGAKERNPAAAMALLRRLGEPVSLV